MPELTLVHFGLLALMLILGIAGGWILRADRCAREKMAISASWQEQLESQQSEHNRLAEQNKGLMEQISQYQASHKDYSNRAKELSDSLKEAFARRDELQRQIKDIRGNLEVAVAQRDRLHSNIQNLAVQSQSPVMKEKDDKIFRLSRELTSWQSRVPPLVERFQERDRQARALEEEIVVVKGRLQALEDRVRSDQTRIEPLDAESLPDGGDASNEPNALTSAHDTSEIQDQIEDHDFAKVETIDEASCEPEPRDETAFAAVFSGEEDFADDDSDWAQSSDDKSGSEQANDEDAGDDLSDTPTASEEDEADARQRFADDRDDLKSIKGIGPSIEKTLLDLGFTRFYQIAEMSEYDIDRVAQQLKGFRSRIYREDWIGQARDLQAQKNGDLS